MSIHDLIASLESSIRTAEHQPGDWASSPDTMGAIVSKSQLDRYWESVMKAMKDTRTDRTQIEAWAKFDHKRDSWLAIQAVNALPKLLAYIKQLEGEKNHE